MANYESFKAKAKSSEQIGGAKKARYVIFDLSKIKEGRAKFNSPESKDVKIVKKFAKGQLGGYVSGDDLQWHQMFT